MNASTPKIYLERFELLLFLVLTLFTTEGLCFRIKMIRKNIASFWFGIHNLMSILLKWEEITVFQEKGVNNSFKISDHAYFFRLSHTWRCL